MYIQIRTIDAKSKITLDVSKTALVSELKKLLEPHFKIVPEKQRLFFRGKQLEDEYRLFDYNINLNDMVQIMEKVIVETTQEKPESESKAKEGSSSSQAEEMSVDSSLYFKVGEFVDVYDTSYGAWCEGRICRILKDPNPMETREKFKKDEEAGWPHDGFFYDVSVLEEGEPIDTLYKARIKSILPRAREKIPFEDVKVGDTILANYNIEEPKVRGFWYVLNVTGKRSNKSGNRVIGTVLISDESPLENCEILFTDELMKIEQRQLLKDKIAEPSAEEPTARTTGDPSAGKCERCKNNNKRKCKDCGCHICGLKTDENKQIMCDECDYAFHIWCLKPPLEAIPDVEEWYCPECKNDENEIVAAGTKLKESKIKARMASKQNTSSNRDWGKGMACIGRTKQCTIVPQDHFGPIPGVEVGTLWKFRIQASEAGVHRPHVAGIHGRENLGAFSVVLSGGYEDDVDNGDEFLYTGSGGRDLSGNKRTNDQSFDQKLERFNKAIAMNCNVPLNNRKGGEAKDWKGGKPVRVIRNYKLAKHSKYAPEEGNRYDGIYKVVKYFPVKGKSGFIVWRFLFRRDDPVPAPWTKEGKKRIESLGLEMLYPEGYLEAQEASAKAKEQDTEQETPKAKGKGKKRVLEESPNPQPQATNSSKKTKVASYTLEDNVALAIAKDTENEKLWEECKKEANHGKPKFLLKVEEMFTCICCTDIVFKPVTTDCKHNFCTDCLKRAFKAEVMTCSACRAPLDRDVLKKVNSYLQAALEVLFPGYSAGR